MLIKRLASGSSLMKVSLLFSVDQLSPQMENSLSFPQEFGIEPLKAKLNIALFSTGKTFWRNPHSFYPQMVNQP